MLRGNCFWRREDGSEWNKCKRSESVREQRIALYKSNQQQQHHTTIAQHSILRYCIPHVPRHISQTFNVATTIFYIWPHITPQSASHHHFTLPHLKAQHITQCTSHTIPHWTSQHISHHAIIIPHHTTTAYINTLHHFPHLTSQQLHSTLHMPHSSSPQFHISQLSISWIM